MPLFVIAIDPDAAESWGYGEPSGRVELDEAFGSVGARVVRVWDTPHEATRPWSWLVVGDLLDPTEAYELLGRAGVDVRGVAPLGLDPSHGAGDDATIDALPERLTIDADAILHDYLAPGFRDASMSVGPGVIVWPCCQGVGEHLRACEYR